jgi:hypothetical protein
MDADGHIFNALFDMEGEGKIKIIPFIEWSSNVKILVEYPVISSNENEK